MNFSLDNLPPLRDVIAAHDLHAEKALGQNFLLDSNVTDKIVRGAGDLSECIVFEIGSGPGGLTRSLLRAGAKRVVAIEFDVRAVRALQNLKDIVGDRLEIIQGDALTVDLLALAPEGKHQGHKRAIVANLPYNVATPLLVGWLKQIYADGAAFESMTLMFQKEVAERICAPCGAKAYGRLGILCQFLCDVRSIYTLPPSAFMPPPKVDSSVVHFKPRDFDRNNAPDFKALERVTAAAFGQRRKMVRQSLKAYAQHFEELGIDPTARAEVLSVEDFLALARAAA